MNLGCHVREQVDSCGCNSDEWKPVTDVMQSVVKFKTGATRSNESTFDPDGFISPVVIQEYCKYMERHRVQSDNGIRASDNWQNGSPSSRASRSLARHYLDTWLIRRGYKPNSKDCGGLKDALCGVIFNAMVLLKNDIEQNEHEEVNG